MIVAGVVGLVVGVLALVVAIPAAVTVAFLAFGLQGGIAYVAALVFIGGAGWILEVKA